MIYVAKNHIITSSATVNGPEVMSFLANGSVEIDLVTQITLEGLVIDSLESVSNVDVYYSAPESEVLSQLPSEVIATLSDDSTVTVPVEWNIVSYDAYAVGDYVIIGDITLPPGVLNPGNLGYSLTVSVNPINIQSIANPSEQTIPLNSTKEYAESILPEEIEITLEHPIDGVNTLTLNANWDTSSGSPFDASDVGETRLLGFPAYPSYITNTNNLEVEALFTVIIVYQDFVTIPSFTSPVTITDLVGSSLESGEVSGANDILVNGGAIPGLFNNRLRPNGISNRRFKSASGRIYVGGNNVATGQQVIAPLNGADNLKYYHLGLTGNSNTGTSGISGLNHLASAGGTTVEAVDLVIKDMSFSSVQINQSTDGVKYSSITLRDVRCFGYSAEGEVFYIGSTNKTSAFSTIDSLVMTNCYGTNKGRDGLQITHVANGSNPNCAQIEYGTIYDVGKANISTQRLLTQIHNTNGYCKKYIFHKAPEPANIFTHGFTFEDCYFEWDTDSPIYIGRLKASDAFGGSALAGNGLPITFRRCYFNPSVSQTRLARILETDCNIVFEDCYFSNRIASGVLANLISDERGASPSNTISNTGYTIGPPLASPTYTNHDPAQEDTHGLCTSVFWVTKHMGYRTL